MWETIYFAYLAYIFEKNYFTIINNFDNVVNVKKIYKELVFIFKMFPFISISDKSYIFTNEGIMLFYSV